MEAFLGRLDLLLQDVFVIDGDLEELLVFDDAHIRTDDIGEDVLFRLDQMGAFSHDLVRGSMNAGDRFPTLIERLGDTDGARVAGCLIAA